MYVNKNNKMRDEADDDHFYLNEVFVYLIKFQFNVQLKNILTRNVLTFACTCTKKMESYILS